MFHLFDASLGLELKLEETMKKMLLLTVGLLALAASVANAQLINGTIALAYGECRSITTAVTANDFTWPNSPCTNPANTTSLANMYASFKPAAAMANFIGATTVLDIQVAGSTLPDFWVFDPLTCHDSGLSGSGQILTTPGGNCQSPYGATTTQTNGFGSFLAGPNHIHWECDHSRGSGIASLALPVSTGGYLAQIVQLSWDDAAFDGATCAGCDVPACIVLNNVKAANTSGVQIADMTQVVSGIQNFVTFYGGAPNCPGAVPTKNSTWGQVKALYR
jgi:hypothetical protein